MKIRHSNNRSHKQNSNRLVAYLDTGIGATLLARLQADAANVNIDLTNGNREAYCAYEEWMLEVFIAAIEEEGLTGLLC